MQDRAPDHPPTPAVLTDEPRRLRILHEYGVLDTPAETTFDRIAHLAARLFNVPTALVSLVDENRQWFKACLGFGRSETPRALSFCAHALHTRDVLVIPDARHDPRFAGNPLVTGAPYIRFYAGAPLITPQGAVLGTLCIIDTQPRHDFTDNDRLTLADLAATVMSELELRRSLTEQRHAEHLNTAVLTTALDAIITMDSGGHITEWNPAAEQLFQYTRNEVLGQLLADCVIPERHRSAHAHGLQRLLTTGEGPILGRRTEVTARRRDGQEFPCELSITTVRVGDAVWFTGYLRDLTALQQATSALQTSHNLLQAVVETIPEAIYVKDVSGRYLMINAAGAAQLGLTPAEVIGRTDRDFFAADSAAHTSTREAQVIATGQGVREEVADTLLDGTHRTYLSAKQVYRTGAGQIQGLIGVSIDITTQKAAEQQIRAQNETLEQHVRQRTQEMEDARLDVLERLTRAAEFRDDDTGEHVRRVAATTAALARALGLNDAHVHQLRRAAALHDVGKIGIPDGILLKPGRLTPDEFEVVKTHAEVGAAILAGSTSPLMGLAHEIALTHHERWDGTGYPRGLKGEAIPLAGRLVAVADVLDALTSERPYKPAWPLAKAMDEIRAQAGRQFDPRVVAALDTILQSSVT